MWGARRSEAELHKLEIDVSDATRHRPGLARLQAGGHGDEVDAVASEDRPHGRDEVGTAERELAASASPPQGDAERIARHLESVSGTMRAAPPPSLTDAQAAARAETLQWLDEYGRRGVFPHNHVRMGQRTPVFVDPHGTPCAVAYLLLRSGESELVEDVVRTANLDRVSRLASDPRLRAWLAGRGITEHEAELIQPTYGGTPLESGVSGYVGGTVGLSILTAALGSYSLFSSKPTETVNLPRALSVASVLGHTALVAVAVGADDTPSPWAVAANVVGGVVGGLLVAGPFAPAADTATAGTGSFSLAPLLRADAYRVTVGVTIRR